MPRGIQPEKLNIEHVRQPGEWVPVALGTGLEGPLSVLNAQAGRHMGILTDVHGVVVTQELISKHRPEGGGGHRAEQSGNQNRAPILFQQANQELGILRKGGRNSMQNQDRDWKSKRTVAASRERAAEI